MEEESRPCVTVSSEKALCVTGKMKPYVTASGESMLKSCVTASRQRESESCLMTQRGNELGVTPQGKRKLELCGTTMMKGVAQSGGSTSQEKEMMRVSWIASSSEDESDIGIEAEEELRESQGSVMYLEEWNQPEGRKG